MGGRRAAPRACFPGPMAQTCTQGLSGAKTASFRGTPPLTDLPVRRPYQRARLSSGPPVSWEGCEHSVRNGTGSVHVRHVDRHVVRSASSIAPALGTASSHRSRRRARHGSRRPASPDKRRSVTSRRRSSVAPVVVGLVCAVVVAFLADLALSAWACAAAWGVVAGTQAAVRRGHSVAVRTRIRQDLKAALALVSLVALAGVSGLVPLADARWGVAVLAAAGVVSRRRPAPCSHNAPATRRVVLVGGRRGTSEACAGLRLRPRRHGRRHVRRRCRSRRRRARRASRDPDDHRPGDPRRAGAPASPATSCSCSAARRPTPASSAG